MTHCIIIGGGIQGMTAAVHLREAGLPAEDLTIIDPHEAPLAVWKNRTEKIGMPYLRSAFVHHLSSDPFSLEREGCDFYGRYKRPSTMSFREHAEKLVERWQLDECWYQDAVTGIHRAADGWQVCVKNGSPLAAPHVILAVGGQHTPFVPEKWEDAVHIYDSSLSLTAEESPYIVIGGGISAAHTAVFLSTRHPGGVTLIKRHAFRVHDFDSSPGWLGPKNMRSFSRIDPEEDRRKKIREARMPGSIPRELFFRLRRLEQQGALRIVTGNIDAQENSAVHLEDGSTYSRKSIIACTGFTSALPEKEWLEPLISSQSLPCASCGYPVLSGNLTWKEGLYCTGALAELEIGPVARNIAGAQRAARKIAASVLA
ncbi:NAD(P)-binding domain-containing protein [Alkalicoccus urumqiensis]|nr:FAD/NAD(P)-binding protein [Alkalicoccus urumqiensis]